MTIKMTRANMINNYEPINVGESYKVLECENLIREEPVFYRFNSEIESGWPGLLDNTIRSYHGWIGTENNIHKTALGVFKVLDIVEQKNGLFRVKLSKDLHPDWE